MSNSRQTFYSELEQCTMIYDSMLVLRHPWDQDAFVNVDIRI